MSNWIDRLEEIEERHQGWETGSTRAAADYRWMVAELRRLAEEVRTCTATHHAATRLELEQ